MIVVWTGHVVTAGRLGITAITAGKGGVEDRLLSSNGIPGTERNRRSDGGGGRASIRLPIPTMGFQASIIYICVCVCVCVYWSSWTVSSMGRDFRDRENILKGGEGCTKAIMVMDLPLCDGWRCSRNRVAMQRSLINSTVVRTSGGRLDRPS